MKQDEEVTVWKRKRRLRGIYKQWKNGLILWEDISPEDQILLQKYYGVGG
jgi:hypothetical protein